VVFIFIDEKVEEDSTLINIHRKIFSLPFCINRELTHNQWSQIDLKNYFDSVNILRSFGYNNFKGNCSEC